MTQTLPRLAVLVAVLLTFSGCDLLSRSLPTAAPASGRGGSGNMSATFNVLNRSSQSLYYFYGSACNDGSWGPDQLGTSTVPSGASHAFNVTPGCWDFRAKFQDGQEVERRGVQFASGSSADWTIRD